MICETKVVEKPYGEKGTPLFGESTEIDRIGFLSTKFNIPQPRVDLVHRPYLLSMLHASVQHNDLLTLLCAPAGFGKTTLLSEWVYHSISSHSRQNDDSDAKCSQFSPRDFAWVNLDQDDNSTIRFWTAIITAIQKLDPGVGLNALAALQSPKPPGIISVITALINDISDSKLFSINPTSFTQFCLIIDDYHFIHRDEIHKGMAYLISHVPHHSTRLHIVLSTRSEPAFSLHLLRARAQITEIRTGDLRFTNDETTVFLNNVMGFELSTASIAAMDVRTEGWIAGLQLAAITMQLMRMTDPRVTKDDDFSSFIDAFTGSSRYVLDYLGEEILSRQTEDVQKFLITTSILDKMTGSLCDAVLGISGSHATLIMLEQSNLFIDSLDQNGVWYRYHRLFGEFLRSRFALIMADDILVKSEYFARASLWCENYGMVEQAISYGLAGELFEESARLIESISRSVLLKGEAGRLLEWVQACPKTLIKTRPQLLLTYLWALVLSGQFPIAYAKIKEYGQLPFADDPEFAGEVFAITGYLYVLQGNVTSGIVASQQALDLLPEDDYLIRGLVALNLGRVYDIVGEIDAARNIYEKAYGIGLSLDSPMISLLALTQLGDVSQLQGRLFEADTLYQQAIQLAEQTGGNQPLAGLAYAGLGVVYYQWNDLESAERFLLDGVSLGQQWEMTDVLICCMVHLAWVRWAQGDYISVNRLVESINQALKGQIVSLPTVRFARAHLARLALNLGEFPVVNQWLTLYKASGESTPNDLTQLELVTWAYISLELGQHALVVDRLSSNLDRIQTKGYTQYEIELLVLLSMAYHAVDNENEAVTCMERALVLSSAGQVKRLFIDNGLFTASILKQLNTNNPENLHGKAVLRAIQNSETEERTAKQVTCLSRREDNPKLLLETISGREIEVLSLLSTGFSNKEIARTLYIATGTVKQHLKNIYGKLDVHNRTQAVNHARNLNLI